jgi:hypothetical protein
MYGLETVTVDWDGQVRVFRYRSTLIDNIVYRHLETATTRLPLEALTRLANAIIELRIVEMEKQYVDRDIEDGSQWILWIRQGSCEKAIYFSNLFPAEIDAFADTLDDILVQYWGNTKWHAVAEGREEHQKELWECIKR